MTFSKGAKSVLKVLIAIYLILVLAFLFKAFTAKESPAKQEAVSELVALSERLHATDPQAHILTARRAEEIFDDDLRKRGDVIGFNYTLFMQMLNFAILFVAMYGLLWEPLTKLLDERRGTIRNDLESAQEQREKAEQTLAEAEQELQETREKRRDFIDTAQREADAEREERLAAARKEAEGMIQRAKREIEAHVAAGKTELRREIARLSVELAEKIIEREIREEDHATLVHQFIAEIESKAKGGSG